MTLGEIVKALSLSVRVSDDEQLERVVEGGYVSDLLSDVIAGSREGDLWITLQIHQNVVAVAVLNNLAGIIVVGGRDPDVETLKKAKEQGVPILVTKSTAYEVAGKLYQMGLHRQV
jgi:predicted transcriptional regulator